MVTILRIQLSNLSATTLRLTKLSAVFGMLLFVGRMATAETAVSQKTIDRKVSVRTLDSQSFAGDLVEVGGDKIVLREAKSPSDKSIPLAELLSIDFETKLPATTDSSAPNPDSLHVMLVDGSVLVASSFRNDGKEAAIDLGEIPKGGTGSSAEPALTVHVPIASIASVLFAAPDKNVIRNWNMRAKKARKSDALELYKDGKRHELEGILGPIGAEAIQFRVDDQDVPVKLQRASAIYYAHPAVESAAGADVLDHSGSLWAASTLQFQDDRLTLRTPAGISREIAGAGVSKISFARGRIVHLSDLEPTIVQHSPFFDVSWDYKRDVGFSGQVPQIASISYGKGLTVHSRTVIEYDLNKEYRRFEAAVGIDDSAGPLGDAFVRVSGDNKVLWEGRAQAGHPAKPIVVLVTNVRSLTLEVDYGEGLDLGDHVVFGDAKVIK